MTVRTSEHQLVYLNLTAQYQLLKTRISISEYQSLSNIKFSRIIPCQQIRIIILLSYKNVKKRYQTNKNLVSLAAIFWMSCNAPQKVLRDIQKMAARETNKNRVSPKSDQNLTSL